MSNNSLKELRLSNGLTQKDVAEKLNMTVSSYAKIEHGAGLGRFIQCRY